MKNIFVAICACAFVIRVLDIYIKTKWCSSWACNFFFFCSGEIHNTECFTWMHRHIDIYTDASMYAYIYIYVHTCLHTYIYIYIILFIYLSIYEGRSKNSKPHLERTMTIFLLWQHTTTLWKTRFTNSDFCLNFCAGEDIQKWEVYNKLRQN